MSKICSGCNIQKSSGDFYRHPHTRDGLQSRCKVCSDKAAAASARIGTYEAQKKWQKNNRAHINAHMRELRAKRKLEKETK